MGSSHWDDDLYKDRAEVRKTENRPVFTHNHAIATGKVAKAVHAKLDPKGVKIREARDSKEHPDSCAIGVIFDITASMDAVPGVMQAQLPKLMNYLLTKKAVKDPQILIGAVGDTSCDPGSLQIGQFESGIEIDEDIGRLWLVGMGGGQTRESYQNAMYFFARHTSIDCFEKRNKKGYLFIIGDEMSYDQVSAHEIKALCGDGLESNIPTRTIVAELKEKYHVFFILPAHTQNGSSPAIYNHWTGLLGREHVLRIEDANAICEVIGTTVGISEGNLTYETARANLDGASPNIIRSVLASIEPLAATKGRTSVMASATVRL